jgi:hypothetical protein
MQERNAQVHDTDEDSSISVRHSFLFKRRNFIADSERFASQTLIQTAIVRSRCVNHWYTSYHGLHRGYGHLVLTGLLTSYNY